MQQRTSLAVLASQQFVSQERISERWCEWMDVSVPRARCSSPRFHEQLVEGVKVFRWSAFRSVCSSSLSM